MATKVRKETIDRIAKLGMARSLKEANEGNDAEFQEAVKRYYPNAKFGAKSAANAQAATDSDKAASDAAFKSASTSPVTAPAAAPAPAKPAPFSGYRGGRRSPVGIAPKSPAGKAAARRVEASPKSMRGVNQSKGLFTGVMDKHKALDANFKKNNPKLKKSIADFFTGGSSGKGSRVAQIQANLDKKKNKK